MPKERSPGYPAMSLPQALGRVSAIYQVAKKHPLPVEQMHDVLGFSSNSGPAKKTAASLMQFGLLEAEGRGEERALRLTERALRIERDKDEKSSDRLAAIREAAEQPRVFKDLKEHYGTDLPASEIVETHLKLVLGFTDGAAPVVYKKFLETADFVASLGDSRGSGGRPDAVDVDFVEVGEDIPTQHNTIEKDDRGQFTLPLRQGRVAIALTGVIDRDEHEDIVQVLKIMLNRRGRNEGAPALPETTE